MAIQRTGMLLATLLVLSCGDDVESSPTGTSSGGGLGGAGPGPASGSGGTGTSSTSGTGGSGGVSICADSPMDPGWVCGGDAVGAGGSGTCVVFCNDAQGNQAEADCSSTGCTCSYTGGVTCSCSLPAGSSCLSTPPCCPPPEK